MSGWSGLWLVLVVGGPLLLGAAIAFAVYQSRHRRRRDGPARDRATRDVYEGKR